MVYPKPLLDRRRPSPNGLLFMEATHIIGRSYSHHAQPYQFRRHRL